MAELVLDVLQLSPPHAISIVAELESFDRQRRAPFLWPVSRAKKRDERSNNNNNCLLNGIALWGWKLSWGLTTTIE